MANVNVPEPHPDLVGRFLPHEKPNLQRINVKGDFSLWHSNTGMRERWHIVGTNGVLIGEVADHGEALANFRMTSERQTA